MKQSIKKSFLAHTLMLSLGSVTLAQPKMTTTAAPQSQSSVMKAIAEKKPEVGFGLELAIEYSQKVAVEEKAERESSTDIAFAPSYRINDRFKTSAKTVFSKENSGARQSSVSDTKVGLSIKGIQLSPDLKSLHGFTGVIPTNEDSKKRDRLQGAIAISNGLALTKTFVEVTYKIGLTKNFHEFTVNAENSPNIEYGLVNSLEIKIPLTDKFSISTAGLYRLGRTYKNFQRSAFELSADLNYDVLDQLSLNLGTTNEGDALKSNGVDSNITAYNEDSSVIRAGITLTL